MAHSQGTFKIGRDARAPGLGEFAGVIDDVRVYSHVLTESELQDVMVGRRPQSKVAFAPLPEDEQTDVARDTVLGWTPGDYAQKHDVYFGTAFADVNNATSNNPLGVLVSPNQDANSYAPSSVLDYGKTYFWRIDEVNAPPDSTAYKGDVWSFTTEPTVYALPGDKITATASSSQDGGPEKTVDGSGPFNDLHSVDTKAMWLSAKGDPGSAWIRYDFDRLYKLRQMLVWNYNGPLLLSGFGLKNATIEYSTDGVTWTALSGTNAFAKASGKDSYACNTTVDLGGIVTKSIRITANSNWGGSAFRQYGLSEVRFLHTPIAARYPSPESEATDVAVDVTLRWRSGREAARHDLYMSTDEQSVKDGTAPVTTVSQAGYGPLSLDLDKTYYWKVNEVNTAGTPATVEGDVWSFSTAEYLVVDDFESYTNDSPKRVFQTWIDGMGFSADGFFPDGNPGNGSGSTVGYDPQQGNIMETATVHGGKQAMPLSYDNTGVANAEAIRTFAPGQNWTNAGIQTLVLYFYGTTGSSGQLYVKVNGTKVVYSGDAANMARPQWCQWNIDLASLGANLQNVTTLTIGIDGAGASGKVYIDDIRLYRAAPAMPKEQVWIEAEATATIAAPLEVFSDKPDASGGKYMASVDAGLARTTAAGPGTDGTGLATYKFTVQGGTYAIRVREIVPSTSSDSWWVRIQGATLKTKIHASGWIQWNNAPVAQSWAWNPIISTDDGGKTVLFTMPAGTYTLEMAYREDGCLLDAFVITAQ